MLQVVARHSNRFSYVIGEITDLEIQLAEADDSFIARQGVYLLAVDNHHPKAPGRVIARFASEDAARHLASFFRLNGHLET